MAAFPLCSAPVSVDGMKPIEEIRKGDWVWSVAPETGDPELKQVEDVFVNETDEIVHVRYGDTEIDATPTHPFYTPDRGWVSAVNLRAGDRLQLVNGEYVTVEQVQHEILESPVKVYNFRVADNHTYYVGSGDDAVLVHNANCNVVGGPHGAADHAKKISKKMKQLEKNPNVVEIYGNRSLKSAGLAGNQRPDIIAKFKNGKYKIWEYASKSQKSGVRLTALNNKLDLMLMNNKTAISKGFLIKYK